MSGAKSIKRPMTPELAPKPLLKRQISFRAMIKGSADASSANSNPGKPAKSRLMDFSAEELARQITLIEHQLFCSIDTREYLDLGWGKPDKDTRSPTIMRFIKWTTHLSYWAVTEILSFKTSKQRAAAMERIIMIGQVCFTLCKAAKRIKIMEKHLEKLNNFNGVTEIVAALNTSAIFRLRKSKDVGLAKFVNLSIHR